MNSEVKLYDKAFRLSLFTIIYNVFEGLVSVFFGIQDETLSLLGFGIDSFIEVLSGIGIAIMIIRIRKDPDSSRQGFEISALRITGFSFYILSAGLMVGILLNLMAGHKPVTTLPGIIVSILSIIVMVWLMNEKKKTGIALDSDPIICDANCTKTCVYMSIVLLAASFIYEVTGFAYADAIGAAGLIYFSIMEGREAFEKANKRFACSKDCNGSH